MNKKTLDFSNCSGNIFCKTGHVSIRHLSRYKYFLPRLDLPQDWSNDELRDVSLQTLMAGILIEIENY
jgi:hypothetical protein